MSPHVQPLLSRFKPQSEVEDSLPQDLHLIFEGLQLLWRGLRDLEDLDGHISVPLALEDGSKGAGPYSLLNGHLAAVDLPVVARVSVAPSGLRRHTVRQ